MLYDCCNGSCVLLDDGGNVTIAANCNVLVKSTCGCVNITTDDSWVASFHSLSLAVSNAEATVRVQQYRLPYLLRDLLRDLLVRWQHLSVRG